MKMVEHHWTSWTEGKKWQIERENVDETGWNTWKWIKNGNNWITWMTTHKLVLGCTWINLVDMGKDMGKGVHKIEWKRMNMDKGG